MFVGAIGQDVRKILAEMAATWRDRPVYVGCSGNFTVERVLSKAGIAEIHGNDVALYSCYVGTHLSGGALEVGIGDPEYAWLEEYMKPGLPAIAALLLSSAMLKYSRRQEPYYQRMMKAYREGFRDMHSATLQRVGRALNGVRLASFTMADVIDFAGNVPDDAVMICSPPTYIGGYERLYKEMDRVFAWRRPDYTPLDDGRLRQLVDLITRKRNWVLIYDQKLPELNACLRGMVGTSLRARPVYVYASEGCTRLALPRQRLEAVNIPREEGELKGALSLVRLTRRQMNTLRGEYLCLKITPSGAPVNLGLLAGKRLVGAVAFGRSNFPWCDAYMMSDFAVRPSIYRRLSKLVLYAALSKEVQAVLEQALGMRVRSIGTTAFTERAISMKYRGIFELGSRKEGRLNYIGRAGQWTLAEGLEQWKSRYGRQ